jgi:hypothetical protein
VKTNQGLVRFMAGYASSRLAMCRSGVQEGWLTQSEYRYKRTEILAFLRLMCWKIRLDRRFE